MATECNNEDFEVGCVLSVETLFGEEFKGRVVTFDRSSNFLVLQAPESEQTRFFNTIHLMKCTRVGRSEDPLRESVLAKTVFMAQLQSVSPFLQSLISMREISSKAVLIVRDGEIELRVCSLDAASLASMVLQAETMFPSSTGCFAFRINVSALTRRLLMFVEHLHARSRHTGHPSPRGESRSGDRVQSGDKPRSAALLEGKTLWIYKAGGIDDLCFLIGLNPNPLRFKPECETQLQTDLKDLHLLPVKVILAAEWFRKLLDFFDVEQAVSVDLMDNFLIWQSEEKMLRLDDPTKFSVQGSLDGKPRRLEVEFVNKKALFHASYLSKTVVMPLVGEEAVDKCVLFLFPIDRSSYFSVSLRSHANAIELKKICANMDAA